MSLPNDFQSAIKDEYGNFGWELANSFSFISEFLGYKVLDISAVETALKVIANEAGFSLTKYAYSNDLILYLKQSYPKVHKVFIRRAKTVSVSDEDAEAERQRKIAYSFVDYVLYRNFMTNEFFRYFVIETLYENIYDCFLDIEETINNQTDN